MRGFKRSQVVVALSIALYAGCGGGDNSVAAGGPPAPPVPFTAAALVANAGVDAERGQVTSAQTLTLDGAKSFFRNTATTTRAPAAFAWSLVSAPTGGTLTGLPATTATTTITVPANPVAGAYRIRLTITEDDQTDSDEVGLVVKPFVINAIADKVQIGFTLPGVATLTTTTIGAVTTGTTTGTVTFAWTGVPPAPFVRSVAGANAASLVLSAPELADVQDVPTVPTILGLWAHAGGYHRLTVTATDGAGNTDSEDVIASFGVPTSGLRNAPLNVPVYLNGGESSGAWEWIIVSQPSGSAVVLNKVDNTALGSATDQQVVWFVPKVEGLYTFVTTRDVTTNGTTTTSTAVLEINAAKYVSDGLVGTIAPNPDLGQCAGCHGGSVPFLNDKVTPWQNTLHARQVEALIDDENAVTQATPVLSDLAPELSKAVTGFYLAKGTTFTGQNDGFDDVASTKGFDHRDTSFAEAESRHPEVARLANIQCESCHGPGSLHFGDSEAIGISMKVDVCARCHEHQPAQWRTSKHREVVASPSTRTTCVRCHTAQAAIDPLAVAFRYPNTPPSLPVPDDEGRRHTATCATCHNPHDAKNPLQLRVHGNVTLPNGKVVAAGDSASCFQCHNSRRAIADVTASRSAPHAPVQGDVLAGVNGAEFAGFTYYQSPHADPTKFVTRAGVKGRWCVTCHMAEGPGPGQPGHDEVGLHTFALRSEAGVVNATACAACHTVGVTTGGPRGEEFNITVARDWDGDNALEGVQTEVAGLFQILGGSDTVSAENPYGLAHEVTDTASLLVRLAKQVDARAIAVSGTYVLKALPNTSANRITIPATPDGELLYKALWNYTYCIEDRSMGIHNTGYVVGLLQSTIRAIEEALDVPNNQRFDGLIYRP